MERTLTAVTQEKHLLSLCFDLFCRLLDFFSLSTPPVVVVHFIGTMNSNEALELYYFFFLSHIFLLLYKPLPLRWAFAVLWSSHSSLSLSLFIVLLFKPMIIFLPLFLCLLFLLFFSLAVNL